jgi:hypothetical protein
MLSIVSAPTNASTPRLSGGSWKPSPRLRAALLSGVVGAGVGAGLSFVLGGCTTCSAGQNELGIGLLVGLVAMYGGWSGYSRA